MNATEIVGQHTSGGLLFNLHADGGVTVLEGGGSGQPRCLLSATRDDWDLIAFKMSAEHLAVRGPSGAPHDGIAWMEENLSGQ